MSDRLDVTLLREKVDAELVSEYQMSTAKFYGLALKAFLIMADALLDIKNELERQR